jgi:hypothetical protein
LGSQIFEDKNMKNMKKPLLPKELYVEMQEDADICFPVANLPEDIDNFDDGAVIGVYKLVETKTVRVNTVLV